MHTYYASEKGFVVVFPLPQGGNKLIHVCANEFRAVQLVNMLNGGTFSAEALQGILDE